MTCDALYEPLIMSVMLALAAGPKNPNYDNYLYYVQKSRPMHMQLQQHNNESTSQYSDRLQRALFETAKKEREERKMA